MREKPTYFLKFLMFCFNCRGKQKLTFGFLISPLFLEDANFKIKGDNSVYDTQIQYNLMDFSYLLSLKTRQIENNNYTFHSIDP